MGRILRGTQGARENQHRHDATAPCFSGPFGCRSSHPNASWEVPFKAPGRRCSTKAAQPAKRHRFRAAELGAAPPAATQSLAAGRLPPQNFQEHRPSCGNRTATTIPAGVFPDKSRFNTPSYSLHLPGCSPVLFSTRETKGNRALRPEVQVHRRGNGSCSRIATARQDTVPGQKAALGLLLLPSTTRATSCFPTFHARIKIK